MGSKERGLPSVARRRGDTGNIHHRSRQTAAAIEKGGAWQSRGGRVEYTWQLRRGEGLFGSLLTRLYGETRLILTSSSVASVYSGPWAVTGCFITHPVFICQGSEYIKRHSLHPHLFPHLSAHCKAIPSYARPSLVFF